MVDDLLEISRIDAGSAELLLDEVEVGELLRQAAASTGAGAVPMDIAAGAAGVRLLVDKRRIERVVANLVENAAQYAGGATRLAVESAPGVVRIVVADHGPGVPATERSKVFDRFYRGQTAGQRGATNGTGLGLALVAEHVRLHGGKVWVEDGTGAENRFIVELPLPDADSFPFEPADDIDPIEPTPGRSTTDRSTTDGGSANGEITNGRVGRRATKRAAAATGKDSKR
jgi:signal transduction histidine kinase